MDGNRMDNKKTNTSRWFENIKKTYSSASIMLVNTLLLFVVINIIAWCGIAVRDNMHTKENIVSQKYQTDLGTIYSGYDVGAINAMLLETWSRPYMYEPYVHFKERPFRGEFVNVADSGYRETGFVKNWPPDKRTLNIFLFGGSTMFGYGVADGETVSAYLEDYLRRRYPSVPIMVYNFGCGNYYSSQESILFLRLLSQGFIPDVAIFVDGLNDFYFNKDVPFGSDQIKDYLDTGYEQRNKKALLLTMLSEYLPLYRVIDSSYQSIAKTSKGAGDKGTAASKKYNDEELIGKVISRYLRNKQLIEGMSNRFSVKPVFVWQPVPTYKYDIKNHLFSKEGFGDQTYSMYGYPKMEQYLALHPQGSNFIWAADIQERRNEPLYVDIVHYSAKLSKLLGDYIGNELLQRRLIDPGAVK